MVGLPNEETVIIRSQFGRGDWNRQDETVIYAHSSGRRWLRETGGRPLYYPALHLFWSPRAQPPPTAFISGSISIKKLSLFSSVSNYLHLCYRLIFALKPGEIIFKVPPMISQSPPHIILLLRPPPENYTKSLSLESPDCPTLDLPIAQFSHFDLHEKRLWFILGFSVFDNLLH